MALTALQQQQYENAGWSPLQISILDQIGSGGSIPAATTTTFGLVKKAATVANPAALTTTQTAGGTYTANEQTMLTNIKADLTAIRTTLDSTLTSLKATDKVMA